MKKLDTTSIMAVQMLIPCKDLHAQTIPSQPQANQKLSPLGDILLETKSQTAQHSLPMLHYLQSCSRAVKLDKEGLMLEESPEV